MIAFITYLIFVIFFIAARSINETNKPINEETFKMKKLHLSGSAKMAPKIPAFLRRHEGGFEGGSSTDALQNPAFQPAWGFRRTDIVVVSTKHSFDWSIHSINLSYYQDILIGAKLSRIELMNSQALAAMSFLYIFTFLNLIFFMYTHIFCLLFFV